MACPECGCKETYQYDDTETAFEDGCDDLERCAACGAVFGLEDEMPEDDDGGFGCCYPCECCMPGLHMRSECHTAADIEAQLQETPNAK